MGALSGIDGGLVEGASLLQNRRLLSVGLGMATAGTARLFVILLVLLHAHLEWRRLGSGNKRFGKDQTVTSLDDVSPVL